MYLFLETYFSSLIWYRHILFQDPLGFINPYLIIKFFLINRSFTYI